MREELGEGAAENDVVGVVMEDDVGEAGGETGGDVGVSSAAPN